MTLEQIKKYIKLSEIYIYSGISAIFAAFAVCAFIGYLIASPVKSKYLVAQPVTDIKKILKVSDDNIFGIDARLSVPVNMNSGREQGNIIAFNGKLTGVFLSDIPRESKAVILLNNDVYVLGVGSTTNGMTLKNVTYNSATVNYNNKDYSLTVDESIMKYDTAAANVRKIPVATTGEENKSENTIINVNRNEIINTMQDVNKLLNSIHITPQFNNGVFEGYRIARVNNDSPVKLLGVHQGDIINRVDGKELSSPAVLFSLLEHLDELSAVSIDITRSGKKRTIYVEIQ